MVSMYVPQKGDLLHHQSGLHRSAAPSVKGRELALFGERISEHLADGPRDINAQAIIESGH